MRNYSKELLNGRLSQANFPNYEEFDNASMAFVDFSNKFRQSVDDVAPIKTTKIKNSSQEWFYREVAEKIALRDKLYKKFKSTKTDADNALFNRAKNDVLGTIYRKNNNYFTNELNENIGRPTELWKYLKDLGVTKFKIPSSQSNFCLKKDNEFIFNHRQIANVFKDFFGNLSTNLLNLLPRASNVYNNQTTLNYYQGLNISKEFEFSRVSEETIQELINNLELNKAPGFDDITSNFLKDGCTFIVKPLTQIINLSIRTTTFPDDCKIAKITPLFKKGSKTEPKITDQFHYC